MVELDLERAITERDQAREACRQQAEKWKQASARADQAKSRIAELEGTHDYWRRRFEELEDGLRTEVNGRADERELADQTEARLQALLDALTGEEAVEAARREIELHPWGDGGQPRLTDAKRALQAARDAALAAVEKP